MAVKFNVPPIQIGLLLFGSGTGNGLTVIVAVVCAVHPFAAVPQHVYTVVAAG
ncbi:MAG: hypothetical protein IPP64_14740 [Bacteroidetes bacterium]|nr:hypothetical protein [Bacteroidota bacterium]